MNTTSMPFSCFAWLSCLLIVGVNIGSASEPPVPSSSQFYESAIADSRGKEWVPLFNGKNLDGWRIWIRGLEPGNDPERIFQVVNKEIHVYRDQPHGTKMPYGVLVTDDTFSDYRLQFEYQWGEKKFIPRMESVRDAGLLYHVVGREIVWPTSVECQVQEGDTGDIFTVRTQVESPVDATGKVFQDLPDGGSMRKFFRANGITRVIKSTTAENEGWNTVEVIVRGDSAIHLVNGRINNYCTRMKAPSAESEELVPLTSGRIALQCEGAELYYRNIRIMNLE